MTEKCVRCGELGEDRRTLHHACFYAMDELKVPFQVEKVTGSSQKATGSEKKPMFEGGPELTEFIFGEEKSVSWERLYYTLRVCKSCRASWMSSIEAWFNDVPPKRDSVGSGIFVRKNGACMEVTEEEWAEMQKAANS